MIELGPCPFCGAKNTDVGFIAHTDDCYLMRRYMNAPKTKLIKSWNTRPLEDELRARLKTERELSDQLYLLLTDDPNTKLLADKILNSVVGEQK